MPTLTITDALTAEHVVLLDLFGQVEELLFSARTLSEVRLLSKLVEQMLLDHADNEKDLAYAVLDHALADRGTLDRMHQDHEEIDESLRRVSSATSLAEAVRLLRIALAASREHFRFEETRVFPAIEGVLQTETLVKLGRAWMDKSGSGQLDVPVA